MFPDTEMIEFLLVGELMDTETGAGNWDCIKESGWPVPEVSELVTDTTGGIICCSWAAADIEVFWCCIGTWGPTEDICCWMFAGGG